MIFGGPYMGVQVSRLLFNAVRLDRRRAYRIAQAAGLHPSTLSRLVNGIERVKPNDSRVIAIGRVLGIPPVECFDKQESIEWRELSSLSSEVAQTEASRWFN